MGSKQVWEWREPNSGEFVCVHDGHMVKVWYDVRRFGWLWLVTSEAMEAAFRRERELSLLGAMRAAAKTFGLKANDVQHVLAPTKRS